MIIKVAVMPSHRSNMQLTIRSTGYVGFVAHVPVYLDIDGKSVNRLQAVSRSINFWRKFDEKKECRFESRCWVAFGIGNVNGYPASRAGNTDVHTRHASGHIAL